MLGVDADLAAIAPADLAGQGRQRLDDRAQKRGLALSVVAHHGRARAVFDFDVDVAGHLVLGIADGQIDAAQRRTLARLDLRADGCGPSPRRRPRRSACSRSSCLPFDLAREAVLARARFLSMNVSSWPALGEDRRVDPLVVLAALALVFEKRVDGAGIQGQLAARQLERLRAGGGRERPGRARRSAQAWRNSRRKCSSRICVRRSRKFVGSSSNSRFGSCSSRAASLTRVCQPPDSFWTGPVEIGPLELESAGHLAAAPIGLAAVAHEELEHGFAGQERVVLAEVAEPQLRMADDLAACRAPRRPAGCGTGSICRPRCGR